MVIFKFWKCCIEINNFYIIGMIKVLFVYIEVRSDWFYNFVLRYIFFNREKVRNVRFYCIICIIIDESLFY